jgi:putative hydrolase of the HAD superfamily
MPNLKKSSAISCLLVDIGGVLLTNGWDHNARGRAAEYFGLDHDEMEGRHGLTYDTYEKGGITLDEYLNRVVFNKKRKFSRERFKRFLFAQSKPYPEMLDFLNQLKAQHSVKLVALSNEGREVNEHRVRKFKLASTFDAFISSCFVHYRKPDLEIYRLALDIAQTPARKVLYLENTAMFVKVARSLGIRGIHHTDFSSTRSALATHGLAV